MQKIFKSYIRPFYAFGLNLIKNVHAKGFFHLLSANYFTSFLAFISQLIVAWWLTPIEIGQIKVLQSIMNTALVVTTFGFDTSLLRLCSMNRPLGERKYIFTTANLLVLPILLLTYASLFIAAHFQGLSTDAIVNHYAPFYLLTLIPYTFVTLSLRFLESLKEFKLLAKGQSLLRITSVLFIIGLTAFFGLKGYLTGTVLNMMIMMVVFFILVFRHVPVPSVPVPHILSLHWHYTKYAVLINFLTQVYSIADILMMNYVVHDKVLIGQYSFATLFVIGFNVLLITFQQMAIPYLSGKSSKMEDVIHAVNRYIKPMRWLCLGCWFVGVFAVPIFVHYIFSGKYDLSFSFFWIIFTAWFLKSFRTLQWTAMMGLGLFKWVFYIQTAMLAFNVIMSLSLAHWFDIYGIAFGQLCAGIFSMFLITFSYRRLVLAKACDHTPSPKNPKMQWRTGSPL